MNPPLSSVDGKPFTHEEIFEAVQDIYKEWCELKAREDGNSRVSLPDFENGFKYLQESFAALRAERDELKTALEDHHKFYLEVEEIAKATDYINSPLYFKTTRLLYGTSQPIEKPVRSDEPKC